MSLIKFIGINTEKSKFIAFISIITVILLLKILINNLINLPLHFDEAQYWDWSKNIAWGYFSKPPILPIFINFTTSICGDTENCLRSLSPVLYFFTTLIISYSIFNITNNYKKSFFGGLLFILMPGVTFSSLMISTDVPLLFFSSIICLIIIKLYLSQEKKLLYYLLFSIAVSLSILAKYATSYIFLSILISIFLHKKNRLIFVNTKFLISMLLILFLISPHILWNINNQFVTLTHTASNANLKQFNFNLYQGVFFLLSQAIIFGLIPIYFLIKSIKSYIQFTELQKFLLLNFTIPIAVILVLSIISRANANWAVVGYPFGCVLLASLIKNNTNKSIKLCLFNQIIFSLTLVSFISFKISDSFDPFYKLRHVRELSQIIKKEISTRSNVAFIADDREDYASMLYYLRDLNIKKAKWNGDEKISDHYELTTDVNKLSGKDVLLLTRTKPTKSMIEKSTFYEKIYSYKVLYKNKKREFNIFIMHNWH